MNEFDKTKIIQTINNVIDSLEFEFKDRKITDSYEAVTDYVIACDDLGMEIDDMFNDYKLTNEEKNLIIEEMRTKLDKIGY